MSTILTYILVSIIFALAGFVLGALVYRNNSKQFNNVILILEDLKDQVKKLKK